MKTLASAQADFRAGDRDNNGTQDFWRGDLAGLYTTKGLGGDSIKLIELRLVLADERPRSDLSSLGERAPYLGYWFRAIPHEGEDPTKPDPQRFAFVASPIDFPKHQRDTVIVDENNTAWKNVLAPGENVTFFPKNPGEAGWTRID